MKHTRVTVPRREVGDVWFKGIITLITQLTMAKTQKLMKRNVWHLPAQLSWILVGFFGQKSAIVKDVALHEWTDSSE